MLKLSLNAVRRVLCLGAHSGDIEIGLGGTLLSLLKNNPELEIYWAVFSAPNGRAREAYASANEYLSLLDYPATIRIESFREGYFPSEWTNIKLLFDNIKANFTP
jgi:LmbE family N-acetylglucosaminyl deacetylase